MIKVVTGDAARSAAIVGGGFAGLSCAINLLHVFDKLTIFDSADPGCGGASAVSAGLGEEGFAATMGLIETVQAHLSTKQPTVPYPPIISDNVGLVRLIRNDLELKNWQKAAEKHPAWLEFLPKEGGNYTGKRVLSAVRIHRAKVVDCPRYLQGLWDIVAKLSEEFDTVILSCGATLPKLLSPQHQLDVKLVRGQNIYITPQKQDGSHPAPLQDALIFGEYIVPKSMHTGEFSVCCGATHEYIKEYDPLIHDQPDLSMAEQLLQPTRMLSEMCPILSSSHNMEMVSVSANAGVRVVTPRTKDGKLPFVGRVPYHRGNVWVVGGFGSRGLIHHALVGQLLSSAIISNDDAIIPDCLRPPM
eukprot:gene23714-32093_t